jgi:arylsulfatase A-like enzyme
MTRSHVLGGLVACVLAGCTSGGPGRVPVDYGTEKTDTVPQFYGAVPKNILMISMDTYRKDHLDRYGDVGSSGFLTALAEQGYSLDDHVQCSNWTYASTSCTLAGRHNEEAGLIPQLVAKFDGVWPTGTPFLASYLDPLGMYGVISTTNGWLGPEWGNTQGYESAFHPSDGSAYGAYLEGRQALDLAREAGVADRWLLHVHATEPHAAYAPPESYLGGLDLLEPAPWDLTDRDVHYGLRDQWPSLPPEEQALLEAHLRVRYAADVQWLDDQVFWMIQDLDVDELLDDTLVIVWTDHGEQFWEHAYQTHAWTHHREETDGILFFWAKNIVPGSWSGPTTAINLVPTLLRLYGLEVPPEVTGLPVGEAPDDRPQFTFAVARRGPESAVTQRLTDGKAFRLIYRWNSGVVQLYDLGADPLEQTDLYDETAPTAEAQALWSLLEPQVALQSSVVPQYLVTPPVGL